MQIAEGDIKQLAKEFLIETTGVTKVSSAALSEVYLLDDSQILRGRELEPDTVDRFESEVALLSKVRTKLPFKIPQLNRTADGLHYVLAHGYLWSSYPMIVGEIPCTWFSLEKAPEAVTKNVLQTERMMHEQTSGLFEEEESCGGSFVDEMASKLEFLKDNGLIAGEGYEAAEEVLKRVIEQRSKMVPSDYCFVHGDFHHGNLILSENQEIIGAIDTDWARVGHPFEDLGFTLMMLMRDYRSSEYHHNQEKLERLISWYGVPRDQLSLLMDYVILYALFDIHLFSSTPNLPKGEFYLSYQQSLFRELLKRAE